ncbi:MAG: hypothetical protein KTR31_31745 [Myxococcales bacterium]|nr:hypothetical protein [Myxococcales bacterium]
MTGAMVVVVAAAALRPGMWRAPAWPVHLLRGESVVTDAVLLGITATMWGARFAGLLLVGGLVGWGVVTVAMILTLLMARRRLRSAAAPLLEDAVWLAGLAVAGVIWDASMVGPLLAGAFLGSMAAVSLMGGLWILWGRGNHFTITARPDFQVFAPNPDNRYALGRIRVGADRHVVAIVPDNGNRFTHVAIYDAGMACVHMAHWDELKHTMASRGHLRVHVGPRGAGPTDADLSILVPSGRYLLTVRNYLAADPDDVSLPRCATWNGRGRAPWAEL